HRPLAVVSADAVDAVAATGLRACRLGADVCAGVEFRLESAGLSERRLVLQSVRLAIVVRVRRLVRARRGATADRRLALALCADAGDRLSRLRLRHHYDLVLRAAAAFRAAM